MIARLSGKIAHIGLNDMIIDVNGVGYLVSASTRTLSHLGGTGEFITLLIETNVREDNISLYGFIDQEEKDWFKRLCTVQGVGARVALAILSVSPPEQLPLAIAAQDKTVFSRADGVGPKLATRIITELKDKVANFDFGASKTAAVKTGSALPAQKSSHAQDAVSALVNLGYGRSDAFRVVSEATSSLGAEARLEELIQYGLKSLSIAV